MVVHELVVNNMKKIIGLILGLFIFVGVVNAVSYPSYTNYVNDFTNTLSRGFIDKENTKLKEYDNKTTNQIAVALIDSTEGDSIENYSIHLADQWKPGQKGKDNGVLMLFAMKDKTMRIEVGRGLEGEITDLKSKETLDKVIKPEFKAGNYEEGIDKGINSLILVIASPSASIFSTSSTNKDIAEAIIIIFIIIFILLLIAASPITPLGGEGTWGITSVWSDSDSSSGSGSSFGGGSFSGGGSSGGW